MYAKLLIVLTFNEAVVVSIEVVTPEFRKESVFKNATLRPRPEDTMTTAVQSKTSNFADPESAKYLQPCKDVSYNISLHFYMWQKHVLPLNNRKTCLAKRQKL